MPELGKARHYPKDVKAWQENPAGARLIADVYSWFSAQTFLGNRDSRKLANNTYVERRDVSGVEHPSFVVKLHYCDIVRFELGGPITLSSCGYSTYTTKARINAVLAPIGWSIYQKQYEWYLVDPTGDSVEFRDNIQFDPEGVLSRRVRNPMTRKGQEFVSGKIAEEVRAGYPDGHGQAGAIAYSTARKRGYKVPEPNPTGPDAPYPHPGKFEGETMLATEMYDAGMESGEDESFGDQDTFGYYQLFTDFEASDGSERHGILEHNSQGFVSLFEYDSRKEAEEAWSNLEAEWSEYDTEG